MAVFDIKKELLSVLYSTKKESLLSAYDVNKNVVFEPQKYATAMRFMKNWLVNQATYTANDMTYVKERYRMEQFAWVNGATAIACAQVMLTYCTIWKYTNNTSFLNLARNLLTSLEAGRKEDGGYEMYIYNTGQQQDDKYTGGNSEVAINMFRTAEIDTDYSQRYITQGLLSAEYLISKQQSDGSWKTSVKEPAKSSMFTAQAIAAIAMGYKHTSEKDKFLDAILKGFNFISTRRLSDGRIKTTIEEVEDAGLSVKSEFWRPPTSDQSIVIRGLAIVELCLSGYTDTTTIKSFRLSLMDYLNQCIGDEGSVRNGLGNTSLANDIYGITDHIYTTSWAIEAYYYSGVSDGNDAERAISVGIVDFCSGNLWFSNFVETNGTLRGAYNVKDHNWDTSALIQDQANEGGADQIYVGWVMSPILTWMTEYYYNE